MFLQLFWWKLYYHLRDVIDIASSLFWLTTTTQDSQTQPNVRCKGINTLSVWFSTAYLRIFHTSATAHFNLFVLKIDRHIHQAIFSWLTEMQLLYLTLGAQFCLKMCTIYQVITRLPPLINRQVFSFPVRGVLLGSWVAMETTYTKQYTPWSWFCTIGEFLSSKS